MYFDLLHTCIEIYRQIDPWIRKILIVNTNKKSNSNCQTRHSCHHISANFFHISWNIYGNLYLQSKK